VIPSEEESEKAKKGLARINTTRIAEVVRAIHEEASSIQIDLDTQPRTRSRRNRPLAQSPATLDVTRRKTRAGAALALQQQQEQAQEVVPEQTPKHYRKKRTF
jgi:hypothetical protein